MKSTRTVYEIRQFIKQFHWQGQMSTVYLIRQFIKQFQWQGQMSKVS